MITEPGSKIHGHIVLEKMQDRKVNRLKLQIVPRATQPTIRFIKIAKIKYLCLLDYLRDKFQSTKNRKSQDCTFILR